jgi:hypothetical protein
MVDVGEVPIDFGRRDEIGYGDVGHERTLAFMPNFHPAALYSATMKRPNTSNFSVVEGLRR